jgi:hypothetical protein
MPLSDWERIWYGVLKSAVQKHVRRGEVELAVATAGEMIRLDGGEGLRKRWPIIVAEDALEGASILHLVGRETLGVIEATARLPQSKEACGLYCDMMSGPKIEVPWFGGPDAALDQAMRDGKIVEAAKIAWQMWTTRQKNEVEVMLGKTDHVQVFFTRMRQGHDNDSEVGLLLAGAILAAAGKTRKDIEVRHVEQPPTVGKRVAWYACDMHTVPGKMAFNAMLRHSLPSTVTEDDFSRAWFWGESARLREHVTQEFWTREKNIRFWGGDPDKIDAIWKENRDKARRMVQWAADKFSLEVTGD